MGADLTRFDFHAFRFMRSENVRAMNAEEVGQYILLLCEAWLTGKDASLPDDPPYLAQLARVKTISPRVMKQFKKVQTQWGERLQNETLFEEWLIANQRSDNGRKAVEARWQYERNTVVSESYIPKPNQSNSNQTNPNQANENDSGDFKNLAVKYRRTFETRLGGSKAIRQRYAEACRQYSESVVLEMFDVWALTATWIRDLAKEGKLYTDGLKGFYEQLPELIEIESAMKKDEEEKQQKHINQEAAVAASIEAGRADFLQKDQQFKQELEEQDAAIQRIKSNPNSFFGTT